MRYRVAAFLAGLVVIGFVIWTGLRARSDPQGWTLWFGLASALLAPIAVGLVGFSFRRGDAPLVRRLSAVPEIQDLMDQAENAQERVRLLQEEHRRLEEIVRLETRRQTLIERRNRLLQDARRVVAQFDAVDAAIRRANVEIESSAVLPEVRALEERLAAYRRGDLVVRIGESAFALNTALVELFPAPAFARALFFFVESLSTSVQQVAQVLVQLLRDFAELARHFAQVLGQLLRRR